MQRKISPNLSTRGAPHDEVLDVIPKKSRAVLVRIFLVVVITIVIGSVAVFYCYTQIYRPYIWRADVGRALTWIGKEQPEEKRELDELTEIRRLEQIGSTLPYRTSYASYKDRSAAAISALELGDHLGSPAARFIYGELLKDGGLLESGESTAQIQFEKGHKKLAKGVQQGDARSILYYGLMLNAGFGIKANPDLSLAAFHRVMQELDEEDLHELLARMLVKDVYTVPDNEASFLRWVAEEILSKGGTIERYDLYTICERLHYRDFIARCEAKLKQDSNKNKQKDLNFFPLDPNAKVFGTKPALPVPAADKELQTYTGYVKGSFKGAQGGLSTFTVDNRQGGADAVARLYLNGSKPAVRSMYVRSGETFKAESLAPGNYVLRYRFIGSEDTFEADRIMSLKQIEGESGTQYSNVTVTLFKQVGGNLNTKKVPVDQF